MPLTGPRTAPALGLRAGRDGASIVPQTTPERRPTMFFSSWLRNRKSSRGPRCQRPRFRPCLETLEDRCLPSTLTVTSPLDDGSSGTLRATIAAAASGDTIVFANSLNDQTITLNGNELLINKTLNIQGPGAAQLAISANHLSRVLEVNPSAAGTQVSLSGLTIRDGNYAGGWLDWGGGIVNKGNLTVSGCVFSGDSSSHGGAIYNSAILALSGCTFSGNSASSFGGAIYSDSQNMLPASNCVFSGNSSAGNGGAIVRFNGPFSFSGCTFSGNTAWDGSGGAILSGGGSSRDLSTLSGCTLSGNSAHYGSRNATGYGGAIANYTTHTMLTACTLSGNSAASGGAIYSSLAYYDSLTISGCTITGNSADVGGGIYNVNLDKATLTITDSTITGNTATSKGGGIYNNGATSIQNTKVSNNSAGAQGGGIFNDATGTLTLYSSSVVSGNLAPDGADLYNLGHVLRRKG
jgi:predicted outer membrane repeat protein